MLKYYIIFINLILCISVYSQNFYYDDISSLEYQYLEHGLGLPFKSFPYSDDELSSYMEKLDIEKLSTPGKVIIQSYYDILQKEYIISDADGFLFNAGMETVLEGYYHWNISNNFDFSPKDYTYQYGYEERQPMLNIPLEAEILDSLSNTQIALAMDSRGKGDKTRFTEGLSKWGDVKDVFKFWAKRLKIWLDETHGKKTNDE